MTVNVRKRRRKIDPDHARKKAIKKAGKTALSFVPGAGIAARGLSTRKKKSKGLEPAKGARPARKAKRIKPAKRQQVVDTDYLYGSWMKDEK